MTCIRPASPRQPMSASDRGCPWFTAPSGTRRARLNAARPGGLMVTGTATEVQRYHDQQEVPGSCPAKLRPRPWPIRVDGTFIWTPSHDQRPRYLSSVLLRSWAAIPVRPEPRWSARSEVRTNDLEGRRSVELPGGGHRDHGMWLRAEQRPLLIRCPDRSGTPVSSTLGLSVLC